MGKKSSSYQEIDPAVGKAMKKQAELSQAYQDWYQNEYYPKYLYQTELAIQNAAEDAAYARDVSRWTRDFYQKQADKANERADAQWDAWKNTTSAEDAMLSDISNFNEAAYRERGTENAMADLTMGYAQQRKALGQGLTSAGVDPTSGRYQASISNLSDEEAYNRAQAILAAEQTAKELGWNKRVQAVQMGQGYLNMSNQYAQSGTDAMAAGANGMLSNTALGNAASQTQLSNLANIYNSSSSNFNSLLSQNQNVFNLGMGNSNINLSNSINQNQNAATVASGYGSAFGSIAGMASNIAVAKMS